MESWINNRARNSYMATKTNLTAIIDTYIKYRCTVWLTRGVLVRQKMFEL